MRSPDELEELKLICSSALEMKEGEIAFILLPNLKVFGHGEMDALLCPQARDGYTTRLFLARQVPGRGNNWSSHRILDRAWVTWSWNNVPADLRLVEILANHLSALR